MRLSPLLRIGLLLPVFVLGLLVGLTARAAELPLGPGTQEIEVTQGGQARKVIVHVPARSDPGQPLPLLVALHGGGGHAAFMADEARYGLIGAADRHGFVVAFPNGYSRLPGGRLATWNAGGCCGAARDRQVDDVGFIRAVVARLQALLPIDAGRIRATGMSNGGMLAHRLACEAADVFSAIAAVAGTDATTDCRPSRPVAVLHLHARDDDHVLFDGGAGPAAFRDRSQVMDFVSVPQTMANWVRRDRCEPQPRNVLQVDGASCQVWSGCADGVPVQLCVTETGGHSWPGAEQVRRGKPGASQALDANEVMQAFFAQVPVRR